MFAYPTAKRAVMLALALILAASVGSAHAQQPSASALATERASCVPEPRPACGGIDRSTTIRAPPRMR